MAMPEPNVTVRQHRNGRLSVFVGGIYLGGAVQITYRDAADRDDSRLIVEVLGRFVRFEIEE